MGQPTQPVAELVDFSGGLNTAEPPDQIGAGQLAVILNLEYRRTKGLKRRRGSTDPLTNNTVFAASSSVVTLFRHTPGQSETSMELWGMSNDATPELSRVAASSAWSAAIALSDAISAAADAANCRGVSFNGKLFLFYNSAVDRLHVWDGASVRRVGIATPAAATVANTGAGAYAAILRYYKVQWAFQDGVGNIVYSALSPSVSFTPSGAGTAARVTRPALAGESETTWVVFGSADDVNYYRIASIVTGTTTFDDTTLPVNYPSVGPTFAGTPTGADYFTPPISAKFGLVDGQQLLLGGSHETTGLSSTVYFTPDLNTSGFSIADDERVPTTNRLDIEPQLGGGLTGLGGPIGGTPLAFKFDRTYLLNPTNDVTLPYTRQLLTDAVGCVAHQGIVLAEDETGAPALYWPARRGYYRYGSAGLEYCGADIEDLWATVNLSATYGITAAYHRDAGQIWIFIPVSSDTTPSVRIKFHVARARRTEAGVRGGWTRDDGNGATVSAVCMFSDVPGATMSLRLKPYIAKVASTGKVYRADADGVNRDDADAVTYAASMVTRTLERGMGEEFGVANVYVQGLAESSITLDVGLRKDFAATDDVTKTAGFTTTRSIAVADGQDLSECDIVQVRVADQAAANQHWQIDRLGVRVRPETSKES